MKIIVISGSEATGKSSIARKIADEFGYTYCAKDVIKEKMFDTEKVSTWRYGWYEKRAKNKFFAEIKSSVSKNKNLVIESNFIDRDKKKLANIFNGKNADIAEIHCYTKGLAAYKRFIKRNESKARHPGHHDRRWYVTVFFGVLLACC